MARSLHSQPTESHRHLVGPPQPAVDEDDQRAYGGGGHVRLVCDPTVLNDHGISVTLSRIRIYGPAGLQL